MSPQKVGKTNILFSFLGKILKGINIFMPKFLDTPTWYGENGKIVSPLRLHLIFFNVSSGARHGTATLHFFNHSSSPITSYTQLFDEIENTGLNLLSRYFVCVGQIYSDDHSAYVDFLRAGPFTKNGFILSGLDQDEAWLDLSVENASTLMFADTVL